MQPNPIQSWLLAIRPKTLTASVSPVLIGTAMAVGDGIHHFPSAIVCLITALMIQIGTNLANDYFDFKKGTDTAERIGPVRVTQAGLISPVFVMLGFIVAFLIAGLGSYWLFERGGIPIMVIGILSILSGILYTAGPFALGYLGLGELFVLIFFGPVAVGGTYYVQSYEINMAVILAGLAPGLISVAILCVNNYRDIESDRKANKKTLAVRFGRSFAQLEYAYALAAAALVPLVIFYLIHDHVHILLSSLIMIPAVPLIHTVCTTADGPALNKTLAMTGGLLLLYSITFSVGWVL